MSRLRLIVPPYEPAPGSEAEGRVKFCRAACRELVENVAESCVDVVLPSCTLGEGAYSFTSASIGDKRKCPTLNDVVGQAIVDDEGCSDVYVFLNADVAPVVDAHELILEQLRSGLQAGFSRRVDVDEFDPVFTRESLSGQECYPGADLFWFTPAWWLEHRTRIPQMFLGFEGWDFVVQALITMTARRLPCILPPLVVHQRHAAAWSEQLTATPGQAWNRSKCAVWACEHGLAGSLDVNRPFLFGPLPENWEETGGGVILRKPLYPEVASA